jgi:hypothetical protein
VGAVTNTLESKIAKRQGSYSNPVGFLAKLKQQHVTPIKTTTLYLKILLDSDWKARLTDKKQNMWPRQIFKKKILLYCNLTLIRFFLHKSQKKKKITSMMRLWKDYFLLKFFKKLDQTAYCSYCFYEWSMHKKTF